MRTNLPVSQHEYDFAPDATLMSTTDTQSHITYANAAFIQVSGFTSEEIQHQPHNLVRHPDMPPEAFADMWATLKKGKSWSALVKNRRKDGDHYWVRANATPVVRNGLLVGYMSVRTRPSRDEVRETEKLYSDFTQGRAGSRRFHEGLIVRTGLLRWMSTFQTMSVRWRIRAGVAGLGLLSVLSAFGAGVRGTTLELLAAGVAVSCGLVAFWLNRQISVPLEQVLLQAQGVAAGQPGENVCLNRADEIGMLLRSINQSGLNLRSLVDDVSEQIAGVRYASDEIVKGNRDLNDRTEQSTNSLQQTATAMDQMTASIGQSADAAREATQLAAVASEAAATGGRVIGQVVGTMDDIATAAVRSMTLSA